MSLAGFMSGGRYFEHWSQEVSGWFKFSLNMNFPDTEFTGWGERVEGEGRALCCPCLRWGGSSWHLRRLIQESEQQEQGAESWNQVRTRTGHPFPPTQHLLLLLQELGLFPLSSSWVFPLFTGWALSNYFNTGFESPNRNSTKCRCPTAPNIKAQNWTRGKQRQCWGPAHVTITDPAPPTLRTLFVLLLSSPALWGSHCSAHICHFSQPSSSLQAL